MHSDIEARLNLHRADYAAVTGKPFRHFYCPILHVDEPVPLQRGHVVNEAFAGSPGAWVVQRQDVDSFYGSFFEADFEVLQYGPKATKLNVFADKKMYQHF